MSPKRKTRNITPRLKVFTALFIVLLAISAAFPISWILASSTVGSSESAQTQIAPDSDLGDNLYRLFTDDQNLYLRFRHDGALPEQGSTAKIVDTFWDFIGIALTSEIAKALYKTLAMAVAITIGSLLIISAASYACVARRSQGFIVKLITLIIIPAAIALVPMYDLLGALKTPKNIWVIAIPALGIAELISILLTGIQAFPKELVEMARLDGVSNRIAFARAFFPATRPTYGAIAMVLFVNACNSLLWPPVILGSVQARCAVDINFSALTRGSAINIGQVIIAAAILTIIISAICLTIKMKFMKSIYDSAEQ